MDGGGDDACSDSGVLVDNGAPVEGLGLVKVDSTLLTSQRLPGWWRWLWVHMRLIALRLS